MDLKKSPSRKSNQFIIILFALLEITILQAAPEWVGHSRNSATHGVIASTEDLRVVVESHPIGSAKSAHIVTSTDQGKNWKSIQMERAGHQNNNDRWKINLGPFPERSTIHYAIEVRGDDNSIWDRNDGKNYQVTVQDATAAISWVGNTQTHPAYGSVDADTQFWIDSETTPPGVARKLILNYSVDDGSSWKQLSMKRNGIRSHNEAWHIHMPGFPEGTNLRYFIEASNAAGETFLDNNTGSDYRLRINSPIRDVYTDKSRYNIGDTAKIMVDLYNTQSPFDGAVQVTIRLFTRKIAVLEKEISMPQWSGQNLEFSWKTPTGDFRGYGIDVDLLVDGKVRDTRSSALDVSSNWARFPRYGFYTNYHEHDDYNGKARELSKFHINAIQYYDWMWTHDRLVPYADGKVTDLFKQFDGREQSFQTVRRKIQASRKRNMASMAYSLVYGDSGNDDGPEHKEWAAYRSPNATDINEIDRHEVGYKIWKMDVTNSAWKKHLFSQFHDTLTKAGFDGMHLDNIGQAETYRYNSKEKIPEGEGFAAFINEARASLSKNHPRVRLSHNDITGEFLDQIAPSGVDFYYSEIWHNDNFQDLRQIIQRAKNAHKNDKQVVLAAYINRKPWEVLSDPTEPRLPTYINDSSAKLLDACIFGNGAFHIELGDSGQMLTSEYFPRHDPKIHPGLKRSMRDYYDFIVRYENFLFFNDKGGIQDSTERMSLQSNSHKLNKEGKSNSIWTTARTWGQWYDTLNLINLYGVHTKWREPDVNPTPQKEISLQYRSNHRIHNVILATPDDGLGRPHELPFTQTREGEDFLISLTVPELKFWSLLIFDKTSPSTSK